jgi:hypothetical protein
MGNEVKCVRCGLPSEHDFESECVQAQYEEVQRLEGEQLEQAKGLLREVLTGADILTDRKWKRAAVRLTDETLKGRR